MVVKLQVADCKYVRRRNGRLAIPFGKCEFGVYDISYCY